jgi:hypothetical protein
LGSNSAFLVDGTHGFAEMCKQAEAAFPLVWQRLHKAAGVLLADMLVGDRLTGCPEAVEAWLHEHPGWIVKSLDVSSALWRTIEKAAQPAVSSAVVPWLSGVPVERNTHLLPEHICARVVLVPSMQDMIRDTEQLGKLGR